MCIETSRSAAGCLELPQDPKGEGVWVVHPTKVLNAPHRFFFTVLFLAKMR